MASCLENGAEVIRQRHACYGGLEIPLTCTPQIAYRVWLEGARAAEYYFSVLEVQFFAAMHHCFLQTYLYDPTSAEEGRLQEITEHVTTMSGECERARVCLTFAEGKIGRRGHFSRLFSEVEWEAHRVALEASGDPPFYSSSNASVASDESEATTGIYVPFYGSPVVSSFPFWRFMLLRPSFEVSPPSSLQNTQAHLWTGEMSELGCLFTATVQTSKHEFWVSRCFWPWSGSRNVM